MIPNTLGWLPVVMRWLLGRNNFLFLFQIIAENDDNISRRESRK